MACSCSSTACEVDSNPLHRRARAGLGNFEQLVIGAGNGASTPGTIDDLNQFFDGTIDEFAVYDRALTAGEVQQLFDGGELGTTLVGTASADTADRRQRRRGAARRRRRRHDRGQRRRRRAARRRRRRRPARRAGRRRALRRPAATDELRGGAGDDGSRHGGGDELSGGAGEDLLEGGGGAMRWPAAPMPIELFGGTGDRSI